MRFADRGPERRLYDRLETIVAAFVDPDHVPGWEYMAEDLRNEPLREDPPVGEHGIEMLPWATTWQALTLRRCVARRPMWFGRCELVAGHECDHAIERGLGAHLRWSTRLTMPPLISGRRPAADEDTDERLDETGD